MLIKMCIKSMYFSQMIEYYDAMLGRQGINGQNTRKNEEKSDFGITWYLTLPVVKSS